MIPAGVAAPAPIVGVVPIGTPPTANDQLGPFPIFPADRVAINGLTHREILDLVNYYNDDFGILPGDTLEDRQVKFSDWIPL